MSTERKISYINRAQVKRLLLELAEKRFQKRKFTRVSKQTLDDIEIMVVNGCQMKVQDQPTKGKTL